MAIVPQDDFTQHTFDFETLNLQPAPELVLQVTHDEQKYWWSELEYLTIPNSPGIYCIVNTKDQSFYVGSATSLKERKHHHFRDLRADNHKNAHLQRAYNRDGLKSFRFCILEHVQHVENLLEREQHYIDTLDPHYNIARTAGSNLGMQFTDEHKGKISAARRANPDMPAQMAKLNADRTGKPLSPAHRATITANNTGRKHTEQAKEKVRVAHLGKPKTPEHAANISAGKMGHTVSEATRARISASKKGQKHSDATKAQMSASQRARERDPGIGAKVSATKRAKREAKLAEQQSNQSTLF